MEMIDVSAGVTMFMPVFAFLLVFAVTYGLLSKTKVLGENKFVHILVSFAVAIIFLASASAIHYAKVSAGWFAAFIISLLFIVLIVGLVRKNLEDIMTKGFAWFIVISLILIFIFSGAYVFRDVINTYLSRPRAIIFDPTIFGVVILVGVTIFAAWLMTREK
ncbi:MAG: hypothetical protein NZ889_00330 [Candidatus Pacearchaeota archaeon]|nr:hypothetical protein [Candidatus Pacearchaeota archaeon]